MSSWEKHNGIFTVGLTGGIGSGKSTVAKIFESYNIPRFDADKHAHNIYLNNAELRSAVVEKFGNGVALKNHAGEIIDINRKELASKVFSDPSKLQELNSMVHPVVSDGYNKWLHSLPSSTPYVIREAAILFESGANKGCDTVITISAIEDIRLERAMLRDNSLESDVLDRMSKQFSDSRRESLSDHIVQNNPEDELLPQLEILHKKFIEQALYSKNDL